MKQTILGVAAALLFAAAGHAATISLDLDATSYQVGDMITLSATLTTDGTEIIQQWEAFYLQVSWDPAVVSVANFGLSGGPGYGSSTQMVTAGPGAGGHNLTTSGPDLLGPATPFCASSGATSGRVCAMITQGYTGGTPVVVDPQTLNATLILQADAEGALGLSISAVMLGSGYLDPSVVQLGPNWLAVPVVAGGGGSPIPPSPAPPEIPPTPELPPAGGSDPGDSPIPEPGSALLFGVGVLGLRAMLGRRSPRRPVWA